MTRYELLTQWLKEFFGDQFTIEPASNDASFRCYYRINTNKKSFIAMDASPDKEDISSFVAIAKKLHQDKIHYSVSQKNLNLQVAIKEVAKFDGIKLNNSYSLLSKRMDQLTKL